MAKYPKVSVQLTGMDGNAHFILFRASKALKDAGVGEQEIQSFLAQATSGDYDNLLQTVMEWVEVS